MPRLFIRRIEDRHSFNVLLTREAYNSNLPAGVGFFSCRTGDCLRREIIWLVFKPRDRKKRTVYCSEPECLTGEVSVQMFRCKVVGGKRGAVNPYRFEVGSGGAGSVLLELISQHL